MCSYFPAHYNLFYKLCITVNHYIHGITNSSFVLRKKTTRNTRASNNTNTAKYRNAEQRLSKDHFGLEQSELGTL